jgi:uncharacterized membrane protein YesL
LIAALRVGARTLRDAWDDLVQLALLNVVWLGLSLTVVLLPPATVAMFEATNGLAHGRSPSLGEFLRAVPRHLKAAWAWALLNVLVGGVLGASLAFYAGPEVPVVALRSVFVVATVLWIVSQLLVWPYRFEQEDPSLRLALRNAILTTLAAPAFSLVIAGMVVAVILLSIGLLAPLAVFATAFLCLLGNHAVLDRLVAFGKRPATAEPIDGEPAELVDG